jgi:HEAT repeat protein
VKELSVLLLDKLTRDRRLEISEYINTHPDEFEKVLSQAFSKDSELKKPLLDIVDLLNSTQMVQVIEQAVQDKDASIRKQGLQAAYRTRVDSLNVQVAEILSNKEEEFEVRKWALHILGSSDPEYYSTKITKITRNKSEDINIRKEAIFALTQIVNDKTLGTLCTLLGDSDVEIRQSGAWALSNIGSSDSINCLLAALDDENEIVRDWAIRGLRDMDDARALQGLADAIHTSPPKEQVRMTRLVIERKSEVILRAIVELLSSEDTHVRCTAAWALSVSPYPPAVPSLKELLNDENEEVRDYARIALIRSGGLDPTDLKL